MGILAQFFEVLMSGSMHILERVTQIDMEHTGERGFWCFSCSSVLLIGACGILGAEAIRGQRL
jgi:hypothetical protein